MDNNPISCFQLGTYFQLDGKQLQEQYKHHISDYRNWEQQEHAASWLLYPENMGARLSIDETSLSNDELYTIVTNKDGRIQVNHTKNRYIQLFQSSFFCFPL